MTTPTFSTAGQERPPVRTVVPIRLTARQHELLTRAGAALRPAAAANAQTGIGEAVRRALDHWLALPADRRRAVKPVAGDAGKMTSLRLLPEEAAVLDAEAAAAGVRGRGAVVRLAVDAWLASPEAAALVSPRSAPRRRGRRR